MRAYDHQKLEKKWQKEWEKSGVYRSAEDSSKPKTYVLDMFPYPSGEGLHVGHPKGYIATDIVSRMARMQGKNVLHPMGWDAFGLPAENYAIKNKVHPRKAVEKNVARFKEQLQKIGLDYDWSREINTTDPEYYKWTQWIFLKLYEKGLAYQSFEPINWCPSCQTGLANEDLDGNVCERCGTVVEKRPMRQWTLKITDYAERLLKDLDLLPEWQEHIKESQRNWIGKSEGALISFELRASSFQGEIQVFTTRPDTLFGATYMVIAPEHPWLVREVSNSKSQVLNKDEVKKYQEEAKNKSEIERTAEGKEKTGVKLEGVEALNPATGEKIPVFVADYVLAHYGTGAIMAVPAHDERDYEFAKKFDLPVKPVVLKIHETSLSFLMGVSEDSLEEIGVKIIEKTESGFLKISIPFDQLEDYKMFIRERMQPGFWNEFSLKNGFYFIFKHKDGSLEEMKLDATTNDRIDEYGMTFNGRQKNIPPQNVYSWLAKNSFYRDLLIHSDAGVLINSDEFDGLTLEEAKEKITEKFGAKKTTYKLRDWVFSRQRYWGEPIPIVHCEKDGIVPVPESELPVKLPEVEHYEPTGTGESPLAAIESWVNTTCPKCGGPAKRETNTMPQWAGSSWYYLRYMDPKNDTALVESAKEKYWAPVDVYVGGAEHATRHLIYARFWHKFLQDIGVVSTPEPFTRLISVGLIQAEDGRKMSKRFGNVINPDDIVETYGADTLRIYEMFMGPFSDAIAWKTSSLIGARRFLERVWRLNDGFRKPVSSETTERALHQTIKKVGEDIQNFKFNTAISQMMIFVNEAEKSGIEKKQYEAFITLLAPFAPHIAEDIWNALGNENSVHLAPWPEYDERKLLADEVTIVVQVNGKVRASLTLTRDTKQGEVEQAAREAVAKWLEGKTPKKVIFVPNRLVNLVFAN